MYLAAGEYLSEAPSPPMTPYSSLPLTHCKRVYTVQYTYSHWEGGGGELTREKVKGQFFIKPVENTNMTDCISSL
jgi:hypothetical protein